MRKYEASIKRIWEWFHKPGLENYIFLILATLLALSIRISLLRFRSVDYPAFQLWYDVIQRKGIRAFANNFSDYNPPYLYLLYLIVRFLPAVNEVVAIKIPSLISDFVCAGFIYQLVKLKNQNKDLALLAYLATLLSPSVILNGSFWGQADSIYTAGLAACLYFLMIKKNWLALISFGIAFAFKLQAVFLLPFLLILWLKREISWKHFLMIPLVYLISILPTWLIGRSLVSLLNIYNSQTSEFKGLALNAPTLYAWIPSKTEPFAMLFPAGIAFSATVILAFVFVVYRSQTRLNPKQLISLALFTVLIVPFTLPEMHERYFFPAEVLSIAFGFYFPDYFYVPLTINLISFFSYLYFLLGAGPIPIAYLALAMAVIIAVVGRMVYRSLYQSNNDHPAAEIQP
jgi:Gpi18-like mannosyltransferase